MIQYNSVNIKLPERNELKPLTKNATELTHRQM